MRDGFQANVHNCACRDGPKPSMLSAYGHAMQLTIMRNVNVGIVKSRHFGPKPQWACARLSSLMGIFNGHGIKRRHEFGRFSPDLVPPLAIESSACPDRGAVSLTAAISGLADIWAAPWTAPVVAVDVHRRSRVDYSLMYVGG